MTKYNLKDFRANSHKHLAVIITKGWMKRNKYAVYSPFTLVDEDGYEFHFDAGFISDGGTLPVWFAPILRYNGKGMAAFLVHDKQCNRAEESGMFAIRAIGDADLRRHLIQCGVNKTIAKWAGSAVKKRGEYLRAIGELK